MSTAIMLAVASFGVIVAALTAEALGWIRLN
jgi:hypothetical protein